MPAKKKPSARKTSKSRAKPTSQTVAPATEGTPTPSTEASPVADPITPPPLTPVAQPPTPTAPPQKAEVAAPAKEPVAADQQPDVITPPTPPPPVTPKSKMNPLLIPFILVLILFLLSAAGLGYFALLKKDEPAAPSATASPEPSPTRPSATPSGPAGQSAKPVAEFKDLAVGDCGNLPGAAAGGNVAALVLPCEQPHQFEVFAKRTHAAGANDPYPGRVPIQEANKPFCSEQFDEYTGANEANSNRDALKDIEQSVIPPEEDNWAKGDRTVVCAANLPNGAPRTGSIKDLATR